MGDIGGEPTTQQLETPLRRPTNRKYIPVVLFAKADKIAT